MDNNLLEVKAALQIRRSAHEVFEAIVNPDQMSNYFISKGSARMETGAIVIWRFPEFDFDRLSPHKTEYITPNVPLVSLIDNPEHMHPVQKEKERQIGSKRFDLNSHSGRYAPIFREKSGIQFIFFES